LPALLQAAYVFGARIRLYRDGGNKDPDSVSGKAASPRDKRVANWWPGTWKALEADLEELRMSAYYASLPELEPAPRPAVVIWG
jgi:hypothetical protein